MSLTDSVYEEGRCPEMITPRESAASEGGDCVIVGAGVGGSLLALLLGRAGKRVTVLENAAAVATKGADFLKPRGIRILDELGLLPELARRDVLRRDTIDFFHDGSLTLSYRFAERTGLGYFVIAPYQDIVGMILDACADLPNVDVRFSTRPVGIEEDDSRVTAVRLADGSRLRAPVFVDTTGPGSPLYDFVAPKRETGTYDHVLRMATVPLNPGTAERNRLWFSSDGWFAYLYPFGTGQARMFVGVPQSMDVKVFEERTIDLGARLGGFTTEGAEFLGRLDAGSFERVPIGSLVSAPYHRANVALLGHAAFACHPMTGQGMSYTMEDATALADILTADHPGPRLRRLLDEYDEARHDVHAALVEYGDKLALTYPDRDAHLALLVSSPMHGGDL